MLALVLYQGFERTHLGLFDEHLLRVNWFLPEIGTERGLFLMVGLHTSQYFLEFFVLVAPHIDDCIKDLVLRDLALFVQFADCLVESPDVQLVQHFVKECQSCLCVVISVSISWFKEARNRLVVFR